MGMRKRSNFIRVNGKQFPSPGLYPSMVVTTAVNAARNANNKVVGRKIGRDNYKNDNLFWPLLDAETWSEILQEFDRNFFSTVEFWDMVNNKWRTLTMYPGDRTADVYMTDENGIPILYKDCKVNIVDSGW